MITCSWLGTAGDHSDSYGDDGEHGVDDSGSDGGVDGLRNSGVLKDSRGVVKDLEAGTGEE